MQRITWSGIALHGGVLPGYPASHGCVRMPFDFAARLFDATRLGMRVIVAPSYVAPMEIAHPALFQSKPRVAAVAVARAAEADDAARKADQARLAVATASRETARAMKAIAKIAELQTQWGTARAELQPKLDALASAREAAVAAEAARAAAAEAAREAGRDREPVSVFISRKSQRLYVRRAFQPILEIPVILLNPDHPIGTHVFTAVEGASGDTDMRWNVVSLVGPPRDVGAMSTGPGSAKAALDRIVIPQETLDRIADMALPRSSLIISDEPLSSETGKETDFVVILSDEPRGGIKTRRRGPWTDFRYERSRDRLPY
jgi:hypothetical protein